MKTPLPQARPTHPLQSLAHEASVSVKLGAYRHLNQTPQNHSAELTVGRDRVWTSEREAEVMSCLISGIKTDLRQVSDQSL